ncbi:hypothetical protein Q7C36_007145 [Tachysurus vachellii]|uniref:Uncharacterized protein n=1 Tax=Tachysurus vachellii TaxID=175792 RepID=A0AA88T671_TACVA|nr:hypothetical protein Q7C36_007145 [Tachysurus vachellii]
MYPTKMDPGKLEATTMGKEENALKFIQNFQTKWLEETEVSTRQPQDPAPETPETPETSETPETQENEDTPAEDPPPGERQPDETQEGRAPPSEEQSDPCPAPLEVLPETSAGAPGDDRLGQPEEGTSQTAISPQQENRWRVGVEQALDALRHEVEQIPEPPQAARTQELADSPTPPEAETLSTINRAEWEQILAGRNSIDQGIENIKKGGEKMTNTGQSKDILMDELGEWSLTHWDNPIPQQADYITMDRKWVEAREKQVYGPMNEEGVQIWLTYTKYHLMREVSYGLKVGKLEWLSLNTPMWKNMETVTICAGTDRLCGNLPVKVEQLLEALPSTRTGRQPRERGEVLVTSPLFPTKPLYVVQSHQGQKYTVLRGDREQRNEPTHKE